jgi:N-acyl-D-amino-acid deacylase
MNATCITRRRFLSVPWVLAAAGTATAQDQEAEKAKAAEIPMKGRSGSGLERINQRVRLQMARTSIPGVSLAVARAGSLVLARGYGWANVAAHEQVEPRTLFGLASVSKSLTAVTVLKLVEAGKLNLDARAFELLDRLKSIPGDEVDPRVRTITIRQLLQHTGGWDRKLSGDANSFSQRVAERMQVKPPITPEQLARFMLGQKLDFDPGSSSRYSNFGYIVLGLVIERVTGQPYEQAVRAITLQPLGLGAIRLDVPRRKGYIPGEAHRYGPRGGEDRQGGHLLITMASGGWLATATDLVRFLIALDGARGPRFLGPAMLRAMIAPPAPPIRPRADGSYFGLGWDQVRRTPQGAFYCKGGGLQGMHAHIEHTESGIDWALLWNGGRRDQTVEEGTADPFVKTIRQGLEEIEIWPETDFFAPAPAKEK